VEVVRFGVGHRRPEGPPGTVGLSGRVIHTDGRGVVTELAFTRNARVEPHSNPNTAWLVVIEGGGWVSVGAERARVAAGEAVLWPAGVPHAAWTDYAEMRAIVVEFAGADDLEGGPPKAIPARAGQPVAPGEGGLAGSRGVPHEATAREGEPY
jgi:quercetin dioxygenase-like cupin family protein